MLSNFAMKLSHKTADNFMNYDCQFAARRLSSHVLHNFKCLYEQYQVYSDTLKNENIYIMRLDSVSAMHFLSLIKVCILIVWCIAIRPWLLVPLKPLPNTVHHWMLSLAKENFLPSVFCSILFSRIKEGYQNSHNSRILKVLVWVTMTRGQQPPVELETKDADDYAKFYIHREGLY